MKKLLLFSTLLCAVLSTRAQVTTPQTSSPSQEAAISRGNWLVGGTIGSTNFNFETETFNINVQPKAGVFISDNAAIGAMINLGLDAYDGGTSFQYGVAPFVRYYFPEGATPTNRWFGEATAGFAGSHREDSDDDNPVSLALGLAAGYTHFVSRTVALEAILGYTYNEADISTSTSSSWSGLGLGLGFQIYLPGRGRGAR
jgi:hypothetical protein